jgi:hypothetical protein
MKPGNDCAFKIDSHGIWKSFSKRRYRSSWAQSLDFKDSVLSTHFHFCHLVQLSCNVLWPRLVLLKFGPGARDSRCVLKLITRPQLNVN